jgi:hypothetical protein
LTLTDVLLVVELWISVEASVGDMLLQLLLVAVSCMALEWLSAASAAAAVSIP